MELQSLALLMIGLFAVASLVYFAYRYFAVTEKETVKSRFTPVTTSCYRLKPTSPMPGIFSCKYKIGLLASTYTDPTTGAGKVKKISGKLILPSMSPFSDATFQVTKKTDPFTGGTIYYLNVVCDVKQQVKAADLPAHSIPGSDLTFSFQIDFDNGNQDIIDNVPIKPIDIEPC